MLRGEHRLICDNGDRMEVTGPDKWKISWWGSTQFAVTKQYYYGQIKEYETGGICGKCEWTHELLHDLVGTPETKRPLGDVGVNLVMVMRWLQKKNLTRVYWVNSSDLAHGEVEGSCKQGSNFPVPQSWVGGNYSTVNELLACHKWFCSIELTG